MCSGLIIFKYNQIRHAGFGLPALSLVLTGATLAIDVAFILKVAFGEWFKRDFGIWRGFLILLLFYVSLGVVVGCVAIALLGSQRGITAGLIAISVGMVLSSFCCSPYVTACLGDGLYNRLFDRHLCALKPGACDTSHLFDDDDDGGPLDHEESSAKSAAGTLAEQPKKTGKAGKSKTNSHVSVNISRVNPLFVDGNHQDYLEVGTADNVAY